MKEKRGDYKSGINIISRKSFKIIESFIFAIFLKHLK